MIPEPPIGEAPSDKVLFGPPVPAQELLLDLDRRLQILEARAGAEAEVSVAVAGGNNTIERIVTAMRSHARALADFGQRREFAQELYALAGAIERGEQ